MSARWVAFVVWAAVAASAAFWGLRLFSRAPQAPAHTTSVAAVTVARGDVMRVLGAELAPTAAAAPAPSARFQLLGVVASRAGADQQGGLALIGIDGKAAKAYRVGAAVEGEVVLQSVKHRTALLGPRDGPASVNLELPLVPTANTSPLPPAAGAATGPVLMPPGRGPTANGARPVVPMGVAPLPATAPVQEGPATPVGPGAVKPGGDALQ